MSISATCHLSVVLRGMGWFILCGSWQRTVCVKWLISLLFVGLKFKVMMLFRPSSNFTSCPWPSLISIWKSCSCLMPPFTFLKWRCLMSTFTIFSLPSFSSGLFTDLRTWSYSSSLQWTFKYCTRFSCLYLIFRGTSTFIL